MEISLAKPAWASSTFRVQDRDFEAAMVRKIRKAVIPAAGFGTRLFPATKAIKKELFPIVDHDGLAKPLIQILLEEALESGIERVCIVVQPGGEKPIRNYFAKPLPAPLARKFAHSATAREQLRRLRKIASCIEFSFQREQRGFGDAVYQARRFVGDEPFLLMLGDHFYVSHARERCARQTLRAWQRLGGNTIAVGRTSARFLTHRGIIAATPLRCAPPSVIQNASRAILNPSRVPAFGGLSPSGAENAYRIEQFCEKPTLDYARRHLRIPGLPRGAYLCMFGLYVLQPEIFDCLAHQIRHKTLQRGEIQLTTALELMRQRGADFFAFEPAGEFLDVGLPETYARAVGARRNATESRRNTRS
jgi:UTP--glucose-1-phosphate uridylyltransferase